MREGVLKVRINKSKRDNVSWFDPSTGTLVNYKRPVSEDLNKVYYTKSLKETQLDLTEIEKGLKTGCLLIAEGTLDGYGNKVAPAVKPYIDPVVEEEWRSLRA